MAHIVEGFWDCKWCGRQSIRGRHRSCVSCSRPRGRVRFYFNGASPAITDRAQIADALAGPDWFCDVCSGSNSARVQTCIHCGDPRSNADRTSSLSPPGRGNEVMTQDGVFPFPRRSRQVTNRIALGLLFFCILANVGLWLAWSVQEHDVIGEVTGTEWRHLTERQSFRQVVRRDWKYDIRVERPIMPVNGRGERAGAENVRNCREELHHYETYACGTERVCRWVTHSVACGTEESCSFVDYGNGYGGHECSTTTRYCSESVEECRDETKYCERPVYHTKCDYDTWVWIPTETREVNGTGGETRWVELDPGPLDRILKHGEYRVTIDYIDREEPGTHVLELTELSTYERWCKVSRARLTIDNLGRINAVNRISDDTAR